MKRKIDDKDDKEDVTTIFKAYRLPWWASYTMFLILVLEFVFVVISEGGFESKPLAVCNGPPGSYCKNPLINSSYCLKHSNNDYSFCKVEVFTGEIGLRPGARYNNFGVFCLVWALFYGLLLFVAGYVRKKQRGLNHE